LLVGTLTFNFRFAGDGIRTAGEGTRLQIAGEGIQFQIAGDGTLFRFAGDGIRLQAAGEGTRLHIAGEGIQFQTAGEGSTPFNYGLVWMTQLRLIDKCRGGHRCIQLQVVMENRGDEQIALTARCVTMTYFAIISLFAPSTTLSPVNMQATSTWPGRPPGLPAATSECTATGSAHLTAPGWQSHVFGIHAASAGYDSGRSTNHVHVCDLEVRQDEFSAGLIVPNSQGQHGLPQSALAGMATLPSTLAGYIGGTECQDMGTAPSDSIKAGAFTGDGWPGSRLSLRSTATLDIPTGTRAAPSPLGRLDDSSMAMRTLIDNNAEQSVSLATQSPAILTGQQGDVVGNDANAVAYNGMVYTGKRYTDLCHASGEADKGSDHDTRDPAYSEAGNKGIKDKSEEAAKDAAKAAKQAAAERKAAEDAALAETSDEVAAQFKGTVELLSASKAGMAHLRSGGLWVGTLSLLLFAATQTLRIMSDFWIRYWSADYYGYVKVMGKYEGTKLYLPGFVGFVIGFFFLVLSRDSVFDHFKLKAATKLHNDLFDKVPRAPNEALKTPIGVDHPDGSVEATIRLAASRGVGGLVLLTFGDSNMRTGEVARVVTMGYDVMHTDVDVVWLRSTLPYLRCSTEDARSAAVPVEVPASMGATAARLQRLPHGLMESLGCEKLRAADVAVSSDNMSPREDTQIGAGYALGGTLNTGLPFIRGTAAGTRFANEWHKTEVAPRGHKFAGPGRCTLDQQVIGRTMRDEWQEYPELTIPAGRPRVVRAWGDGSLYLSVLPLILFQDKRAYFVQRAHEKQGVRPIAVRATCSLDNHDDLAKMQRFREAGLWHVDSPDYYFDKFLVFNSSIFLRYVTSIVVSHDIKVLDRNTRTHSRLTMLDPRPSRVTSLRSSPSTQVRFRLHVIPPLGGNGSRNLWKESFLGGNVSRDRNITNKLGNVIFGLTSRTGKDISQCSYFEREEEMFLMPHSNFIVSQAPHERPSAFCYCWVIAYELHRWRKENWTERLFKGQWYSFREIKSDNMQRVEALGTEVSRWGNESERLTAELKMQSERVMSWSRKTDALREAEPRKLFDTVSGPLGHVQYLGKLQPQELGMGPKEATDHGEEALHHQRALRGNARSLRAKRGLVMASTSIAMGAGILHKIGTRQTGSRGEDCRTPRRAR